MPCCAGSSDTGGRRSGPPRPVLELAAGPAEHARELARRGIDATALDLSPAMCTRAGDMAAAAGLKLTVVQADMRDFSLPGRFDLAITMLNSLCHLMTLDDLLRPPGPRGAPPGPRRPVHRRARPPGRLLLRQAPDQQRVEQQVDGGTVSVRWGAQDQIDPVTQVTREHVSVTYRRPGGAVRTVTDVVPNRFWTATELAAAHPAGGRVLHRGQLRRLRQPTQPSTRRTPGG